jgi:transposase
MSVDSSTLGRPTRKARIMSDTLIMSPSERTKSHVLRMLTSGKITVPEASADLGITERHCYRLKAAYQARGDAALVHGLRGRQSNFRYPAEVREEVLALIRRRYIGFGPTHLSELLSQEHGVDLDAETLRRWMLTAGLWQRARKGRKHRRKRPRRTASGELIQFDGSHHDWFEGRGPRCCLFVFIDDATNRSLLWFAPAESEQHALEALMRYVQRYGIPAALYVDRHSVYWNEQCPTQFGRALAQLGCKLIFARSPQAKGRVERANRTHQDRLVKHLRLAGISSIEEANAFLDAGYLDAHNHRFASLDGIPDVHRPATPYDLKNIICHEEERAVNHDMTIQVKATFYQILPSRQTLPIPRQRVIVRHWLDGSMHVFWREREIAVEVCPVRPKRAPMPVHPAENHPWRNGKPIGKARWMTIADLCRHK